MSGAGGAVCALRSLIIPRTARVAVIGLLLALLAATGNGQPAYAAIITVKSGHQQAGGEMVRAGRPLHHQPLSKGRWLVLLTRPNPALGDILTVA